MSSNNSPDFSDLRDTPEDEGALNRLRSDPRMWIAIIGGVALLITLVSVIALVAITSRRANDPRTTNVAVITVRANPTTTPSLTPISSQTLTLISPTPGSASPTSSLDLTLTTTNLAQQTQRSASLSEIKGTVQVKANPVAGWTTVSAPMTVPPGATILTSENSSVKVTFTEGTIVRIGAQTQFTIANMSGDTANPSTILKLDFGKVWTIVTTALGGGKFEVQMPVGVAAVRGSYMSAESNSTDNIEIVTCLEGLCSYNNRNGNVNLITNQQTQSTRGGAPSAPRPLDRNQLNDWAKERIPEVLTLTPTTTPTSTRTNTFTPTLTRTRTNTFTPSMTFTPSLTPTPTFTTTPTNTATNTATNAPTNTPTNTATNVPAPVASKLVFSVQPAANIAKNTSFSVSVAVQDVNGNTLTSDNSRIVSIAFGTNAGGGTLSGTLSVGTVNGVATFNNLSINNSGTGYTLSATSNGLNAGLTSSFNVVGPMASLVWSSVPTEVVSGQSFNMTLSAKDSLSNPAIAYTGTVTFSSPDTQAVLPAAYVFTSTDAGVKSFGFTLKTTTGVTQTITAYDSPISGVTSSIRVAADHLEVSLITTTVTTTTPYTITVTALGVLVGDIDKNYIGTINLTSNCVTATFSPTNTHTFTTGEQGVFSGAGASAISVTFTGCTSGTSYYVEAKDAALPSRFGKRTVTVQ